MVMWGFYVQEHQKAKPAVFLVLKRLRRRGHCLKSHPTDWEKPGIESATVFTRHRLIPYNTAADLMYVAVLLDYNQYWPGGFMVLWFYIQEHPKAQPAAGSEFKASQKTHWHAIKEEPRTVAYLVIIVHL